MLKSIQASSFPSEDAVSFDRRRLAWEKLRREDHSSSSTPP